MPSSPSLKLWKKFWFSLVKCFLLATPTILFTSFFFGAIAGLFLQEKIDNYAELISSEFWKPFNKNWYLSRKGFILFGISAVGLYFFFSYLYEFYARKLIIKISADLKNRTLEKFRHLPLEEQLKRRGEISSLVERDNEIVSYHWVNFWRRLFEGCFSISLFFYAFFYYKKHGKEEEVISNRLVFFTLFWIALIVGTIYLFYKVGYHRGKINKETMAKEHAFINQEINNAVLINSMGLRAGYQREQQNLTKQSNQTRVATKKIMGLEMTIPWKLLVNLFPLGFFILEPSRIKVGFQTVWRTINDCAWAFGYLAKWSDYTSSQMRVSKFLSVLERDDNLKKGIKLPTSFPIEGIIFDQVTFKYQEDKKWINYNTVFAVGKVNYLSTPNGSGKTTQLYLLLGLLTPAKGKIIIKRGEVSYNLSKINLKHWRAKNVAFCSYQTLIKEGSAGQRQLVNLKQVLKDKKQAQVFIFDEAENALDKEKQTWFQTQLKELVKEKKIVIYVRQAR
ncbi:MAG: ABC transporter ATP-binding protein [Candidatus Moeniiplasma glomeromycotorum]|nr:ABC transporter ATP-binding protein [Candidatus Moeniiplasma glomeromycotorum]MCE8167119.1 ABC transporter ATP-binding protein [Candidatus Moeniiplasma glomeromycotorum]MCE8168869.1 ABC transporter ATP-binding protein [Candidatus Moeniiplasma glomeromycotorum]